MTILISLQVAQVGLFPGAVIFFYKIAKNRSSGKGSVQFKIKDRKIKRTITSAP